VSSQDLGAKAVDPIYGEALKTTWEWLAAQADPIDFGIDGLSLPEALTPYLAPSLQAPILLPAHLDAWAQTSPVPYPNPDVSLWLHGPERGQPEVRLIWRGDLAEAHLRTAQNSEEALEEVLAIVSACPPSSLEAISLPLYAVRAWLRQEATVEVADVEGAITGEEERRPAKGRPAFRWRGDESEVVSAEDLRPGDTLVVPALYGGLAKENWDPEATEAVRDLGDRAQLRHRGRPTLRLHPGVLAGWLDETLLRGMPRAADPDDAEAVDEAEARLGTWLGSLPAACAWLHEAAGALRERRSRRLLTLPHVPVSGEEWHLPHGYHVLCGRKRIHTTETREATSEDDASAFSSAEVTLRRHLGDVTEQARAFAAAVGLSAPLAADMVLAARLHDVGKADPRFQQLLLGGDAIRAEMQEELLAKSALPASDARARERARQRAGYPRGTRHEVTSLALLEAGEEALAGAHDADLVRYLVASHHGWCRPFAPPLVDRAPVTVRYADDGFTLEGSSGHDLARLDSGVVDRFWALVERYGWHGLAWLEAILRLADHRASEAEQGRA
jgi:CRISPR-associated endonuclease/helicase Cas3